MLNVKINMVMMHESESSFTHMPLIYGEDGAGVFLSENSSDTRKQNVREAKD